MKKVTIPTTSNQKLVGTIFYPKKLQKKNPAVLFLHGWTSDETGYKPRAEALVKLGYICLTINIRGHGESDGELEDFSRADHIDDTLAAYDFLSLQKGVDKKDISIMGTSYGGYLAAVLCGKREVKNLALRAPALYYNKNINVPTIQLVENREEEFFQDLHPEKDNMALIGIKSVKGDLLLIASEKDQIIPYSVIEIYKNKAGKNITVATIKNADHQLSKGEWKQEFIDILTDWFSQKKQTIL